MISFWVSPNPLCMHITWYLKEGMILTLLYTFTDFFFLSAYTFFLSKIKCKVGTKINLILSVSIFAVYSVSKNLLLSTSYSMWLTRQGWRINYSVETEDTFLSNRCCCNNFLLLFQSIEALRNIFRQDGYFVWRMFLYVLFIWQSQGLGSFQYRAIAKQLKKFHFWSLQVEHKNQELKCVT